MTLLAILIGRTSSSACSTVFRIIFEVKATTLANRICRFGAGGLTDSVRANLAGRASITAFATVVSVGSKIRANIAAVVASARFTVAFLTDLIACTT